MANPDDCYSDHAHDIETKGACAFCGSRDSAAAGEVLPWIERADGLDPLDAAAYVTKRKTAVIVDGTLLDLTTASAITAVGTIASPEHRDRLRAMPLAQAADACLRWQRTELDDRAAEAKWLEKIPRSM